MICYYEGELQRTRLIIIIFPNGVLVRGQGFQHSITDVESYVNSLVQLREAGWESRTREKLISEYDRELIERGARAVKQSLSEADNSLGKGQIEDMLMATVGHSRET